MSEVTYSSDKTILESVYKTATKVNVIPQCKIIFGRDKDANAFRPCSTKIQSVIFTDDSQLEIIQNYAFYLCTALTTINLENCKNLRQIGDYAFYGCSYLNNIIFKEKLESIGTYSFASCTRITNPIYFPQTLQTLGERVFNGCKGITTVQFADGCPISVFEKNIFKYTSLTSLRIPKNIASLGWGPFEGVTTMKNITLEYGNENFKLVNGMLLSPNGKVVQYCPSALNETVTVPDGVETLNSLSFDANTLKYINLPNGLKTILSYAFQNSMLESITFPDSVKSVANYGFSKCTSLRYVTLSENLQSIGNYSFQYTAIETIEFKNNLETIGGNAFAYCQNLTSVLLPASLKTFEGGVFFDCKSLKNITFAEGSPFYIDSEQFILMKNDSSLISQYFGTAPNAIIEIPSETIEIGKSAFQDANNIIGVHFQEDSQIERISASAFYNCNKLKTINLPLSILYIGERAFYYCIELTSKIEFGPNINNIRFSSFQYCKSITEIVFHERTTDLDLYPDDSYFYSCFDGCTKLAKVTLCERITKIPRTCFSNCPSLESIEFPSTLEFIGENAFQNSGIKSVTFRSTGSNALRRAKSTSAMTTISYRAFYSATHLSEIVFPASVEEIDTMAFFDTNFSSVTLPSSVKILRQQCFANCSKLTLFVTESDTSLLETIDDKVFEGCQNLENISVYNRHFTIIDSALVDSGVTEIVAFPPASPIKFYSIPSSVKSIKNAAFIGCRNLIQVSIPDNSVEKIGIDAFQGALNLKIINFPLSVTSIGSGAFSGCRSIQCGIPIENTTTEFTEMLISRGVNKRSVKGCINTCQLNRGKSHCALAGAIMVAAMNKK